MRMNQVLSIALIVELLISDQAFYGDKIWAIEEKNLLKGKERNKDIYELGEYRETKH